MKQIITSPQQVIGDWICARIGGLFTPDCTAVGLVKDGQLIAGVMYDGWNGVSVRMHVAAEGKKWLNREFLWYAFHYPFVEMGAKKIIGLVDESNEKAIKFDENIGFTLEARLKHACKGGDLLIYTMTRDQCKHLKE